MAKVWMAAVLAGGLAVATPVTAQSFSKLYVFGDSLVDSGNAQAGRLASGGADPAPAAQGYYQGRFSNGYNFADDLSFSIAGGPATASAYGGINYSVGGAQAVEVAGDASPSFIEQLASFATSGATIDPSSLVLVTLGGNDVRSELAKVGANPSYTPSLTPTLNAFAAGLTSLVNSGARNIIVTGLPDIGQIPAVTQIGSVPLSQLGTQLSFGLNQQLSQLVGGLATQTGYNLQFFDLFAQQQKIYADPAAYGLPTTLNTQTACIQAAGAVAAGCDGYVYFDTIHPTAQLHAAIADGLISQLGIGAVPEPATWLTMVLGLGMVGASLRFRRAPARRLAA